jgi:lipopolysaccharide/colanic/teichoic acid biosynthesis glycosyltransferase
LAVSWFYFLSFTNFTPKTILFICWGLSFVFLFFWRYLVSVFIRQLSPTRVALIESPIASEIKNHLDLHPALGYQAFLYQNLEEFKEKFIADKIKLFVFESKKENEELILELAQNGISLALMSNFYEEIFGRVKLDLINDEWFVNYFGFENWSYLFLKRLFDFLFALMLLTLTSPLALLVALAIKLTSPGPIFYRSLRLGQNLKPFQVYKFRTMIKEADKIGPALTLDNDKRITPLGRWLRKLHLDEWPQLINILAGELSVIGPRPVEVKLAETFNEKIKYYRLRHLVRPGVTGWAQLNYRYSASLEDEIKKLEYDLYYLKYRGFVLDFTIFIKSWRIPFDIKSH